jgi:hypothetical protein
MREIRSFVVRVYRRDAQGVAGVVEDVRTGCIHSFHSALDLWLVLTARVHDTPTERKSK